MFGFQVHHQVEGLADAAVGFGYLAAAIDRHQQPRDSVIVEDAGGGTGFSGGGGGEDCGEDGHYIRRCARQHSS